MFKFYIMRLVTKVLCWFVPGKQNRLKLKTKFGFGDVLVRLDDVDSFVPEHILGALSDKATEKYKNIAKSNLSLSLA